MPSFYQFSFNDLKSFCMEKGLTPLSADLLFNWHHKKNKRELCEHHNLPIKTRQSLVELNFDVPKISHVHLSKDKTVKFLFELNDGKKVETVLIPFQDKYTICLSS